MNNTEIWCQVNGEKRILDLNNDEIISLNYSLADIKDISSRNSSYSKTIVLPDSLNNRMAFEYISELTSDSLFNPNLKAPCYIFNRGVLVFRGNLQLKSINQNFTNTGNTYEVVVFNEVDTFLRTIGEKYMSDMDFSYLNHEWNLDNIVFSWTQSQSHGYFYPLIDRGALTEPGIGHFPAPNSSGQAYPLEGGLNIQNFEPAIYAKTYLDRIFIDSGYTYRSNFLNSDYFKQLIVPNTGQPLIVDDEILDNQFLVNYTPSSNYSQLWLDTAGILTNTFQIQFDDEISDPNNVYQGSPTYSYVHGSGNFIQAFGSKIILNVLVGATVSGFLVGQQNINNNGGVAGPSQSNLYNVQVDIAFRRRPGPGQVGVVPIDGGPGGQLNPLVWTTLFGSRWNVTQPLNLINNPNVGNDIQKCYPEFLQLRTGADAEYIMIGNKCYASFSCYIQTNDLDNTPDAVNSLKYKMADPGELIDVLIRMTYNTPALVSISNDIFLGLNNGSPYSVAGVNSLFKLNNGQLLIGGDSNFTNIIRTIATPYTTFNMNSVVSRKFKQKDFIKGLISMFNLYIEPDETNNKILNIEPRDDYYSSGETFDWTDKVDIQSIKTTFASDYQAKKTIFTYKQDTDTLNELYKKATDEIYGQEIVDFDSDFVISENKIECSFSPTPLIALEQGDNRFPISRISKDGSGSRFENNLRILFKGYYDLEGNKQFWYIWDENGYNEFTAIPYAGHLDNPFNPTEDLNFGQVYTTSFNWEETSNTLTNRFYQNYIDIINNPNTKLYEADFYLNESDISNLKLNSKIYLDVEGQPSHFIINKIMNYNPVMTTLTKVELIKIK
jgi:hypothetical protein